LSTTLCLSIVRWIASAIGIPAFERAETARGLKIHFHGNSNGVDIAAVSANAPIVFEKGYSLLEAEQ
jgi:hypothetical protein